MSKKSSTTIIISLIVLIITILILTSSSVNLSSKSNENSDNLNDFLLGEASFSKNTKVVNGIYFTKDCKKTKIIRTKTELGNEFLDKLKILYSKYKVSQNDFLKVLGFMSEKTFSNCYANKRNFGVGISRFDNDFLTSNEKTFLEFSKLENFEQLDYLDLYLEEEKENIDNMVNLFIVLYAPEKISFMNRENFYLKKEDYLELDYFDENLDEKISYDEIQNGLEKFSLK